MKRVSDVQSKKSLRAANEERQYGHNAVPRFGNCAGKIIDLFAQYVEDSMTVPLKAEEVVEFKKNILICVLASFIKQ